MISELQNRGTLDLIFTIRGGVPTSPYTTFEHVNLLTFNIYFENPNCNFSIISMFSLPHISQPYVIMGTTIWLKSLRRTSRGKNKHLALRSRENIALLPLNYNIDPLHPELAATLCYYDSIVCVEEYIKL